MIEILQESEEGNAACTAWEGGDSSEGGDRVKVRESVQESWKCDKRCEMLVERSVTMHDGLWVQTIIRWVDGNTVDCIADLLMRLYCCFQSLRKSCQSRLLYTRNPWIVKRQSEHLKLNDNLAAVSF